MLVKAAKAGQFVVRLYGGDPFMFCNAAADAAVCAKAKIGFEIVPGVSAVTVPAYAGIPLTKRRQRRRPDHPRQEASRSRPATARW